MEIILHVFSQAVLSESWLAAKEAKIFLRKHMMLYTFCVTLRAILMAAVFPFFFFNMTVLHLLVPTCVHQVH